MSSERERALLTYDHVVSMGEEVPQEYRTLVLQLPVLLRTAGLLQTLAYLHTRKPKEANALLTHLGVAIGKIDSRNRKLADIVTSPAAAGLVTEIAKLPTSEYLAVTASALASADWYVRHVQARPSTGESAR
jgi:CRISPR/Cas system CMR-associated protein Cmr5 small subunit